MFLGKSLKALKDLDLQTITSLIWFLNYLFMVIVTKNLLNIEVDSTPEYLYYRNASIGSMIIMLLVSIGITLWLCWYDIRIQDRKR